MHAVIFEVEPQDARRQDYLDLAARLRPELERIDGFISVERFESLSQPGKILSLSFWRDEAAVERDGTGAADRQPSRAQRDMVDIGGAAGVAPCGGGLARRGRRHRAAHGDAERQFVERVAERRRQRRQ